MRGKPSVMLRWLGIARDQTALRMLGGTPCHQSRRSLSYLRPCLCSMAPSSTPFVSDSRQNGSDSRSLSSRCARSSSIEEIFTVDVWKEMERGDVRTCVLVCICEEVRMKVEKQTVTELLSCTVLLWIHPKRHRIALGQRGASGLGLCCGR